MNLVKLVTSIMIVNREFNYKNKVTYEEGFWTFFLLTGKEFLII